MGGLAHVIDLVDLVDFVGLVDLVSDMSWGLREKNTESKRQTCRSRKPKHNRSVGLVCLVGLVGLLYLVEFNRFGRFGIL